MYRTEYQKWLDSDALTGEEKAELTAIAGDEREIESRFFAPLSFGTAGLRGTMGVGLNRMNIHVIRHATQGFAEVILAAGEDAAEKGVVICYDCRVNSELFAREAACVMAAAGIRVRLFSGMRPTPELSFAIRHYGATGGINVTASHNPKEYNGYKVYWSDGAQLPPNHAQTVAESMAATDIFLGVRTMDYDTALGRGLITLLGAETDEVFLKKVMAQSIISAPVEQVADTFKVVYTPFHGTGRELVPAALRRLGLRHVLLVEEQMTPDGTFPTVESPNPENPEGFHLALELAEKEAADLIIGTDPDADRVGVMARRQDGFQLVTGNQMGVLLLNYLIKARKKQGTLPERPAAIKTIVTTEMARAVAEAAGVAMYNTFTGFKFMAEKMGELSGREEVIFCYEESYGYMTGDFLRDKDAVTASMLIAEMAAWYRMRNMTLFDGLDELYGIHGHYVEKTMNLIMPGLDGLRKMEDLMAGLRSDPPRDIAGQPVVTVRDYLPGEEIIGAVREKMELSGSNVIGFTLQDGTNVLVRPSGTEPKVKVYILARGEDAAACQETVRRCTEFAEGLQGPQTK